MRELTGHSGRLTGMRLAAFFLALILGGVPIQAQKDKPCPVPRPASAGEDAITAQTNPVQKPGVSPADPDQAPPLNLPVSIDRIRDALEQSGVEPLAGLHEIPTFKVEVHEKPRFKLEDLVDSLDFRSGPTPPGGLYGFEQQRQMWPAVDNPLGQPYSAFNQPELLTILVENLVGKYLAGRAVNSITSTQRAHAEAQARDEVAQAIAEYCVRQPNGGVGIQICANASVVR